MVSVTWYNMEDNSATYVASPTRAPLVFATCEESNATKIFLLMLILLVLCYCMAVKALGAS